MSTRGWCLHYFLLVKRAKVLARRRPAQAGTWLEIAGLAAEWLEYYRDRLADGG